MRFEKTGEVRCPKKGEWFEGVTAMYPLQAKEDFRVAEYPILRPIPDEPSEREQRLVGLLKEALDWLTMEACVPSGESGYLEAYDNLVARIREALK